MPNFIFWPSSLAGSVSDFGIEARSAPRSFRHAGWSNRSRRRTILGKGLGNHGRDNFGEKFEHQNGLPTKRDGHHISQLSPMTECARPGGWFSPTFKSALLAPPDPSCGAFAAMAVTPVTPKSVTVTEAGLAICEGERSSSRPCVLQRLPY